MAVSAILTTESDMISFDATDTTARPVARSTFGTTVSPVLDNPPVSNRSHVPSNGSEMVVLCHNAFGWSMRYFGIAGVGSGNALPMPCPTDASVAQVVERIHGRWPKAWIMVAPDMHPAI